MSEACVLVPQAMPINRLMVEKARQWQRSNGYQHPALVVSEQQLLDNVQRFRRAMPRVRPYYAVKANPHPQVLATLIEQGLDFEIASQQELDALLQLGQSAEQIIYSNPIKSPVYIRYALSRGLRWLAVDSPEEVLKIHAIDPGARLYLRVATSNRGSLWPLKGKFGADQQQAEAIIELCAQLAMDLAGITFHVGSQCLNATNWRLGIRCALQCFQKMQSCGLRPRLLNLGGGFPVPMTGDEPALETIGATINSELAAVDPCVQVIAEPGRALVGQAGCLLCQVVGTATREGRRWLYLDCGFYSGLMEWSDKFRFPLYCDRQGWGEQGGDRQDLHRPAPSCDWTIAGPTCDAIDVCTHRVRLPAAMQAGDIVYIPNTGAYSTATAVPFNGFPVPELCYVR